MDKDTLNAIICTLNDTSIAECEIAAKSGLIRIVRNPAQIPLPKQDARLAADASAGALADEEEAGSADVTSSWVGYFYRGASKGAKPCARLRDTIKEGQQIGSVTVMNVLQKVTSPVAGKLLEFLVEDGQAVEYGQPLARLKIEEPEQVAGASS